MEFKPLRSLEVYLQSLIDAKLWVKVLVALFLGIGAGVLLSPNTGLVTETFSSELGDWLALPGKLFLKMVQMIMIPLIFASIITGIVSATGEQLKKLGLGLGVYFVFTTTISIIIGTSLTMLIRPGVLLHDNSKEEHADALGEQNLEAQGSALENIPDAISSCCQKTLWHPW